MKKIKTKMMIGIFSIFLVSFVVLMVNIGANQRIASNSQSLLKNNYPSVKYSFEMLDILDRINDILLYNDSVRQSLSVLFEDFNKNLKLQTENITEPGEKELTNSLNSAYTRFQTSVENNEFSNNISSYHTKFENLRDDVLSIHDLNISLLESKNEEIKQQSLKSLNVQQKVGIIGLTVLSIFILLFPMFIVNPIDKLTEKMLSFYKSTFNKDIEIEANHELEKLEEIFERIVKEYKETEKKDV